MSDPVAPVHEFPRTPRRLHVAVVTETYPPEVNGVALSAARFVGGLRARGHWIRLVRPRQGRMEAGRDEMLVPGAAIPFYPGLRMGLPAAGRLVRLWRERRPDVVHVVTEGPLGWSALRAAARLDLPVVSDFRTNFHAYSRHYGLGWLDKGILSYLRGFHNRTLQTLVPTEALRGELAQHGFRGLRVIARGIDTRRFDPARRDAALRASWGAQPGDPVVLHVGRLAAEKNLQTLAAAFAEARRHAPRAKLVLVGDGPQRQFMQQRFPDAVLAGMRTGADLAAHYASADVFLFPSLTETFGNVTLEAMASGLALVAFDYAAARELVRDGESGVLAAYGDARAFVERAAALIGDGARIRRLGARARVEASGRDWERVVLQLEATLADAATRAVPGNLAAGVAAAA